MIYVENTVSRLQIFIAWILWNVQIDNLCNPVALWLPHPTTSASAKHMYYCDLLPLSSRDDRTILKSHSKMFFFYNPLCLVSSPFEWKWKFFPQSLFGFVQAEILIKLFSPYWLSVTQLSSPIAYWAMSNGHDKTHFEMDAHTDGSLLTPE